MLALVFCLLFPAPRANQSITETDLIGDYDVVWGPGTQDLHFSEEAAWSRFGGGPWSVDSARNTVDFQEGDSKYRMELKKFGTGFVGVGYRIGNPNYTVEVRLTRRE